VSEREREREREGGREGERERQGGRDRPHLLASSKTRLQCDFMQVKPSRM
jgi:hypothetical protein